MKKSIFTAFVMLFIVLLAGCIGSKPPINSSSSYYRFSEISKNIKIAKFEHIKDYELPIRSSKYNLVSDAQIVETDTGRVLIVSYRQNDEIFFYNLKTQELIKTVQLKGKLMESFYYINPDSIFVFISPHQNLYYYHDSSLVMVNEQGKVKEAYSWKDAPVWSTEKTREISDSVSYSHLFSMKLAYSQQKIMMPFSAFTQKEFGDDVILSNRTIAGYFETSENKFYPTKIKYPGIDGSFYYPFTYEGKFPSVAHDGEFNISFIYTPEFYRYNSKNKAISKHSIKSSFLDSILPFYEQEEIKQYGKTPEYSRLLYDKYRNLYFRTIGFYWVFGRNTVIVADTSYNFVAEGVMPEGVSKLYFTNDFILAPNHVKTAKVKNKVVFSAYKLSYTNGTNMDIINELVSNKKSYEKGKEITTFFEKELKIRDRNHSAAIVVWENCFGTVDFIMQHFVSNLEGYQKNNVNLVIVTGNKSNVEETLKDRYKISPDSQSNVFVVDFNQYSPYLKYDPEWPRVVSVRKKRAVYDTIFGDNRLDKEFQS